MPAIKKTYPGFRSPAPARSKQDRADVEDNFRKMIGD
jgi:hypothetical protein